MTSPDNAATVALQSCPVCGAGEFVRTGCVEDSLWRQVPPASNDHFRDPTVYNHLNRCRSCAVEFLSPRLQAEALREFYQRWYRQRAARRAPGPRSLAAWRRNYLPVLERAGAEAPLLDVGCGTGEFLAVACAHGWTAEGLEWDATAADEAARTSGCRIMQAQLAEADLEPGSFGTVTMFDYLEHSMTPGADLNRAVELLRPGGTLIVRVPNWDSLCARLTRRDWGYFCCVHLTYFTPATLRRALADRGLEAISVRARGHRGFADVWGARMAGLRARLGRACDADRRMEAPDCNSGQSTPVPAASRASRGVHRWWRRARALALEQLDLFAGLIGRGDVMVAVARKSMDAR